MINDEKRPSRACGYETNSQKFKIQRESLKRLVLSTDVFYNVFTKVRAYVCKLNRQMFHMLKCCFISSYFLFKFPSL